MTRTEHLLTIAAEECSEVAQRISKALRFGLTEVQPGQDFTNAGRIIMEFEDLLGVIRMLQDEGVLPVELLCRTVAKQVKVRDYLNYSKTCGTLKD